MKKRTCRKLVVLFLLVCALCVYFGLYSHITGRHGDTFSTSLMVSWENDTLNGTQNNKTRTEDQAWKRVCTQSERLRILEETCGRRQLAPVEETPFQQIKRLLVDDRHKLIYCGPAKTGSTAWLTALMAASGKPISHPGVTLQVDEVLSKYGLRRLGTYSEQEIKQRLQTYFKFIGVRHPFERVVSAWFDKLIMPDGPYHKLSMEIADKYKIDRTEFQNSTNATYWNTRAFFVEFARHLFDTHKKNPHWMNFDEACNPCAVKWDAILKVESMNHDSAPVLNRLGTNVIKTSLPVVHSHQNRSTLIHFEKKLDEIGGIRPDVLGYLHKEYDHDLAMFGYSWDQDKLLAICGQTESDPVCC